MPAWAEAGAGARARGRARPGGSGGGAAGRLVSRTAFRVCADPANLPFSNEAGEGFENAIAELFAENLGRELQYTWYPMSMASCGARSRQPLRRDPGYAQGDELVLNTNHYYTSTHVLVTRADGDLAEVTTLADPRLKGRRIGVIAGTRRPAISRGTG